MAHLGIRYPENEKKTPSDMSGEVRMLHMSYRTSLFYKYTLYIYFPTLALSRSGIRVKGLFTLLSAGLHQHPCLI